MVRITRVYAHPGICFGFQPPLVGGEDSKAERRAWVRLPKGDVSEWVCTVAGDARALVLDGKQNTHGATNPRTPILPQGDGVKIQL